MRCRREPPEAEPDFLPMSSRAYLYLLGTPFKALATGEFIEEQIFNWTYTDEQRAKAEFAARNPGGWNPYGALPQMRLLTYQMPDELLAVAGAGEFDEFDLNEFFAATGTGDAVGFNHKAEVQTWLDIIRLPGALSLFGRAPASLSPALLLVSAQRGRVPCHGEPAGRTSQYLLASLPGGRSRGSIGGDRFECPAAGSGCDHERL